MYSTLALGKEREIVKEETALRKEKEAVRGPVKDSLTYHPSSQGWASGVLPLIICLFYGVYVFCVGNLVGSWFLSFLSCESFLASML